VQYRALRLPVLPDRQAEILRKLDIESLLRSDLLVVGTNAFASYELACNAKFPVGNEEIGDFDLAWCKNTRVRKTNAKEMCCSTPLGIFWLTRIP